MPTEKHVLQTGSENKTLLQVNLKEHQCDNVRPTMRGSRNISRMVVAASGGGAEISIVLDYLPTFSETNKQKKNMNVPCWLSKMLWR